MPGINGDFVELLNAAETDGVRGVEQILESDETTRTLGRMFRVKRWRMNPKSTNNVSQER